MRKHTLPRVSLALVLVLGLAHAALAQTTATVVPSGPRSALASFPDSQAVLYINARRVVNEMMPRLMPRAEYQKMLAEANKVGFDITGLEYAAVGVRFATPAPPSGVPEFVVVVRGNFNADTLLALAKLGLSTENLKRRQEAHGSKVIEIIDTTSLEKIFDDDDDKKKEGEAKPGQGAAGAEQPKKPPMYPEIGAVALDANTLVVGVPDYVKAAIDASGGTGRLKPETLDLAAQDPSAVWSFTAEVPPTLNDYLQKYGMPKNPQVDEMLGWVRQVSLSQGMTALDFTLRAALLTDQPEHASAFSGLVRMGQLAAQTALSNQAAKKTTGKDAAQARKDVAQARQGLAVLRTFVNRVEGSTLVLGVSVSQKAVADFIASQQKKPAPAKATKGRRARTTRRR